MTMIDEMICFATTFSLIIGRNCYNKEIFHHHDLGLEEWHSIIICISLEDIQNRVQNIMKTFSNTISTENAGKHYRVSDKNQAKEQIIQWSFMGLAFMSMAGMMDKLDSEIYSNAQFKRTTNGS